MLLCLGPETVADTPSCQHWRNGPGRKPSEIKARRKADTQHHFESEKTGETFYASCFCSLAILAQRRQRLCRSWR